MTTATLEKVVFVLTSTLHHVFAWEANKFCPVSSQTDPKLNGTYAYPLDIYDPDRLTRLRSDRQDAKSIYNCSTPEWFQPGLVSHSCILEPFCPLTIENVMKSKEKTRNWPSSDAICDLKKALATPGAKVNVFFLGGSVTFGESTSGCCCKLRLVQKCNNKEHNEMCDDYEGNELCRWTTRWGQWLQHNSVANIALHDFSERAAQSSYMAERFGQRLHAAVSTTQRLKL